MNLQTCLSNFFTYLLRISTLLTLFYALLNETRFPMYNDAEEEFDTKLRLENNLNEVAIGYWESEDGNESYYSKVCKQVEI